MTSVVAHADKAASTAPTERNRQTGLRYLCSLITIVLPSTPPRMQYITLFCPQHGVTHSVSGAVNRCAIDEIQRANSCLATLQDARMREARGVVNQGGAISISQGEARTVSKNGDRITCRHGLHLPARSVAGARHARHRTGEETGNCSSRPWGAPANDGISAPWPRQIIRGSFNATVHAVLTGGPGVA